MRKMAIICLVLVLLAGIGHAHQMTRYQLAAMLHEKVGDQLSPITWAENNDIITARFGRFHRENEPVSESYAKRMIYYVTNHEKAYYLPVQLDPYIEGNADISESKNALEYGWNHNK